MSFILSTFTIHIFEDNWIYFWTDNEFSFHCQKQINHEIESECYRNLVTVNFGINSHILWSSCRFYMYIRFRIQRIQIKISCFCCFFIFVLIFGIQPKTMVWIIFYFLPPWLRCDSSNVTHNIETLWFSHGLFVYNNIRSIVF